MLRTMLRTIARPSLAVVSRQAAPHRRFSSMLGSVLDGEIAEEKQIDSMDEGLKALLDDLKAKGMTVKDEPGKAVVRVYGTGLGNEKVMVEFNCQEEGDTDDWLDDEDGDEMDVEDAHDEEEDMNEDAGEISLATCYQFTATVSKGSDKLVFNGTAASQISLSHVSCLAPDSDPKDTSLYAGPVFSELDERVQKGMLKYLEERNINEDMAAFICMYADHKEQTEYMRWLETVKRFVC
ncbi:unnamed protein product [Discosporangium mesarthrocarpum]